VWSAKWRSGDDATTHHRHARDRRDLDAARRAPSRPRGRRRRHAIDLRERDGGARDRSRRSLRGARIGCERHGLEPERARTRAPARALGGTVPVWIRRP
jgi:hypothetical protein